MDKERCDVLVVDDDPSIVVLVEDLLTEDGYAVRTARSGASALTILEACSPSVLLLDVMMPGMSGPQVYEVLQARGTRQGMRVLFMSAHLDLAKISDDLGADGSLPKPFDLDRLEALIAEHCPAVAQAS